MRQLRRALTRGFANRLAWRLAHHNGYKTVGPHATLARVGGRRPRTSPSLHAAFLAPLLAPRHSTSSMTPIAGKVVTAVQAPSPCLGEG